MSTSISLTVSPAENIDNEKANNRSFGGLRRATYTVMGVEPSPRRHIKPIGLDTDLDPELFETSPSKTTAGQSYGRHHATGNRVSASAAAAAATDPTHQFEQDAATGKLRRWRHHDQRPRTGATAESENLSQQDHLTDFYAEVDDRMSRNSFEYPTQQARYIDRWLADAASGPYSGVRSKSFEGAERDYDAGGGGGVGGPNVIGIRGFSSDSFIAESKQCREDYARLKQDYLRLQVDYRKLRTRFQETADERCRLETARPSQRHMGDMEASLRALVIKQGRRLEEMTTQAMSGRQGGCSGDGCKCNRVVDLGAKEAALVLAAEQLKCEGERLRRTIDERDQEVRQLREQVAHLQLEPANRKLLELTGENTRLRNAGDAGQLNLEALRADYLQLEACLRTLMEGQKSLGQEQGDEMNRVLLELCQFQVSQPKLEMLLDTERQIKMQLQEKITKLLEERERQQEEINGLASELNATKLRARANQTNELEKCRAELASWQAKCTRLEEERASLEGLLRASKAKCVQLDARISGEVQQVRELHQRELADARADAQRCEHETSELRAELKRIASKLAQCDDERRQASEQTLELRRQLEFAQSAVPSERARGDWSCKQLEASERALASCREQLASQAASSRELKTQLELSETQLEHTRRQHADLRRRFEVQQKLLDETQIGKDRELARLRVDLNFERYNRQVSVRGIEKELRSSLRELEAMKCRFARRLCNGGAVGHHCDQSVTKPAAAADGVAGGGDTLPTAARKVS